VPNTYHGVLEMKHHENGYYDADVFFSVEKGFITIKLKGNNYDHSLHLINSNLVL